MEKSPTYVSSRGSGASSSFDPEAPIRPATRYTPLFLATLCVSVSMLGGCAAAGVAAAIREATRQSDVTATATATIDASALLKNQTISIPPSSTRTYSGSDVYSTITFSDDERVTSSSSPSLRSTSVSISTDTSGEVNTISYSTPNGLTSFTKNQISVEKAAILGENESTGFVAIQQEYSSFGLWLQALTSNTLAVGAMIAGSTTSTMPSTGTAIYSGAFTGTYTSSSGSFSPTFGAISSTVNFGSRTGSISAPSVTFDNDTSSATFGFSGGITVSGSAFSGIVTDNRGTAGSIQGAFFGPSAVEMGGTFSIRGIGLDSHIGSFGMSQ